VILTSCNAVVEKKLVGIWVPVLRDMLFTFSKAMNKRKELILNEMIEGSDVEDSKHSTLIL